MFTSDDVRRSYIDFFTDRGHVEIPGASLVPESDSGVLFTIAGIQPLVPYFGGVPHPAGRRLVNYQRCLRTLDIDEVGDDSHLTCFEMLGNWSLGDYYKRESITWTLEWLVDVLGLSFDRLSVTIFEGDEEARSVWESLGMTRISELDRSENWWGPPGPHGPCGPDSEVFYDGVEIGNNVFIAYDQLPDGSLVELPQHNVDVGLGFERIVGIVQGVNSIYETDLFVPIADTIRGLSPVSDTRALRIVADHLRSSVLLIGDGVLPSNSDQGYVLRRLLRRAIRQGRTLGIDGPFVRVVGESVLDRYSSAYPHLTRGVLDVLEDEELKFARTLQRGLREIARLDGVDGRELFRLFETHGLPPELTLEELGVDPPGWREEYERALTEHQQRSRAGAAQRFRGGLDGSSPRVIRLHTATHLLGAALREVLGDHVHQRGSNITDERLRFDFSHSERLTADELSRVEALVNSWIDDGLDVEHLELPREEAEALGAEHEFGARYPDVVSVYVIGPSKEYCGGPHVSNTRSVGRFRVLKQEASSAGVRRLKATVDD